MPTSSANHDALVARLRSGDDTVLADLFSLYRERLWRMVHFRMDRRLAGRVDPDDIIQEAYLAAAQRLEHFRANSGLTAFGWLRAVAHQTLIDVHRRHLGAEMREAGREVAIDHCYATTSASLVLQLAGSMTSPSRAAMRAEISAQLEQAIEGMDALDREVLALRHYEELTNSEVAEALGIEANAASVRYFRALKRLKTILSKMSAFEDEAPHG